MDLSPHQKTVGVSPWTNGKYPHGVSENTTGENSWCGDLTVITVTWNSAKYLADQIRSVVAACAGLEFEQIIVDNASRDETVKIIERDWPRVKLIKNNFNAGFAGGYNQAVKTARGRYFLYLNPDMKILDPLGPLIKYLDEHPKVGLLGAKLVGEKGEINLAATPRRFPRGRDAWALFFKLPHVFPRALNQYLYRDQDFSRINVPLAVDSVRGSFMMTRRVLSEKLGFAFDPRYFLWWEDVDLCRETRRLGYQVVWHPGARCLDRVGQSFRARPVAWKQWIFFKSALIYFKKWITKN